MTSFRAVGKCIYCGASGCELFDEHIIPYSLNGTLVLAQASCADCADVTKRFEQKVARSMYGVLRIKRDFRTRRKKERPHAGEVPFINATGERRISLLPMSDVPTVYGVLDLPEPGIISGAPRSESNPEVQIHLRGDVAEISKALSSYPSDAIELSAEVDWGAFSRLLAKIAHSYLVAVVGEVGYEPLLPDLILGKSRHLAHLVGGVSEPVEPEAAGADLAVAWRHIRDEPYLTVYIQLLGRGRTPIYQVVAAKVEDVRAVESSRGYRLP